MVPCIAITGLNSFHSGPTDDPWQDPEHERCLKPESASPHLVHTAATENFSAKHRKNRESLRHSVAITKHDSLTFRKGRPGSFKLAMMGENLSTL